jgi:hypothetical protein
VQPVEPVEPYNGGDLFSDATIVDELCIDGIGFSDNICTDSAGTIDGYATGATGEGEFVIADFGGGSLGFLGELDGLVEVVKEYRGPKVMIGKDLPMNKEMKAEEMKKIAFINQIWAESDRQYRERIAKKRTGEDLCEETARPKRSRGPPKRHALVEY